MLTLTEQLQRVLRHQPQAPAVIDDITRDTWASFGARVMGIALTLKTAAFRRETASLFWPATVATTWLATSLFHGSARSRCLSIADSANPRCSTFCRTPALGC